MCHDIAITFRRPRREMVVNSTTGPGSSNWYYTFERGRLLMVRGPVGRVVKTTGSRKTAGKDHLTSILIGLGWLDAFLGFVRTSSGKLFIDSGYLSKLQGIL
jgi:hypothetical protein